MYLCAAYRCSNMELGPIMSGKYKCEKTVTPTSPPSGAPSGCHLVIFVFQKWKFSRRLWCKSQAITLCGVEGRIKPSNHSSRCLGAGNIMPYPLDRSHISMRDCSQQQLMPPLCRSLEAEKVQRITNMYFFFSSHWCVKSSGGNISRTQQGKKAVWIH